MHSLLKRFDFIAYILIANLIGVPVPAMARSKAAVTAVPASQGSSYSDLDPKFQDSDTALTPEEQKKYGLLSVPSTPVNDSAPLAKTSPATVQAAKIEANPQDSHLQPRPNYTVSRKAPKGKLKVVVLELSDGTLKPQITEKVTDTIRDEMMDEPKFFVVSKEQTRAFFLANPNLMQRIDVANPLNRYLDEARQFYASFHYKEAIGLLSNTIDTFKAANPPMTESFLIVDAHLVLGDVHMGDNDKKDAKAVFKEAVRLDPEREISQKIYAPKTVRKFVEAKQEYLAKAKTAKLDIFTNPKNAEVYINGVNKGTAPIKVDRFTQGEHFILAKKDGFKPFAKKVSVNSNYSRVKLDLEKDSHAANTAPGLTVRDLRQVDEQARMAGKVGNQMNADKVVLVSVQEIGYNNKITARMIDMKYYASHKPKSVEVLDLPKDIRSAASVISKDLVAMADHDLGQNPKKYADSEVIVIGKKKKKSFWKSPLLWTLLGVAVAGGATAGILLGTNGGGGDGSNTTTVSVSGAANRAP